MLIGSNSNIVKFLHKFISLNSELCVTDVINIINSIDAPVSAIDDVVSIIIQLANNGYDSDAIIEYINMTDSIKWFTKK